MEFEPNDIINISLVNGGLKYLCECGKDMILPIIPEMYIVIRDIQNEGLLNRYFTMKDLKEAVDKYHGFDDIDDVDLEPE